ncbi:MAG: class I SAM-dependent methyltransferase [Nanoarchaeota archaeon]
MRRQLRSVVKVFDSDPEVYERATYPLILQYQLNQFITFLSGKKVLDVGCAIGRDLEYFRQEGINAVGIDASFNLLQRAKSRGKVMQMDALNMSFKDNSFHGIWANASVIFTPKRKLPVLLGECFRVLKKKGILFVSAKEGEGEKLVPHRFLKPHKVKYSFYHQQELEQYVEEAGFTIMTNYIDRDNKDTNWINIFARKD